MPTLMADRRAHFIQQIDMHIKGNCRNEFEPTDEYPGSPGKIEVLRERLEASETLGREMPLCRSDDSQIPLTRGWKFATRNNGRVPMEDKALFEVDQVAAREETLRKDAEYVREEIRRLMGVEGFSCRARAC